MFEIVADKVTAVPTVAVVGIIAPAVRSLLLSTLTEVEQACVTVWDPAD